MIPVKFKKLSESAVVPEYKTEGAAGMDLCSAEDVTVKACAGRGATGGFGNNRALVKTNIAIEIPKGYEAQVRPRSGLAYKHGITVLNSPGTIDSDYRGDVGVILINHGPTDFVVKKGDRIAQLVLAAVERADFVEIEEELEETSRGDGGFGSTGK